MNWLELAFLLFTFIVDHPTPADAARFRYTDAELTQALSRTSINLSDVASKYYAWKESPCDPYYKPLRELKIKMMYIQWQYACWNGLHVVRADEKSIYIPFGKTCKEVKEAAVIRLWLYLSPEDWRDGRMPQALEKKANGEIVWPWDEEYRLKPLRPRAGPKISSNP